MSLRYVLTTQGEINRRMENNHRNEILQIQDEMRVRNEIIREAELDLETLQVNSKSHIRALERLIAEFRRLRNS